MTFHDSTVGLPKDRPMRGSTVDYCSVLADGEHYYAHHVGPGGYFRQCLSCNYVDASEMADKLAAQERFLVSARKLADAFQACIPIIQQLVNALGPILTAMAVDAEKAAHPLTVGAVCDGCGGLIKGLVKPGEYIHSCGNKLVVE